MADKATPTRTDMEKAEGDRPTAEGNLSNSENSRGARYRDEDGDNAGGITNRPLDEEIDNQQALPQRGQSQPDAGGRAGRERARQNKDEQR
jgi:hypothetical protein